MAVLHPAVEEARLRTASRAPAWVNVGRQDGRHGPGVRTGPDTFGWPAAPRWRQTSQVRESPCACRGACNERAWRSLTLAMTDGSLTVPESPRSFLVDRVDPDASQDAGRIVGHSWS